MLQLCVSELAIRTNKKLQQQQIYTKRIRNDLDYINSFQPTVITAADKRTHQQLGGTRRNSGNPYSITQRE